MGLTGSHGHPTSCTDASLDRLPWSPREPQPLSQRSRAQQLPPPQPACGSCGHRSVSMVSHDAQFFVVYHSNEREKADSAVILWLICENLKMI